MKLAPHQMIDVGQNLETRCLGGARVISRERLGLCYQRGQQGRLHTLQVGNHIDIGYKC